MKKTKRILSAALAAVLLATAAAGCQKSEQGAANGKTVIVGAATDLKTLDTGYMYEVYGNMVSYSLYDMLFRIEGEDMSNPKLSLIHISEPTRPLLSLTSGRWTRRARSTPCPSGRA